MTRRDGLTPMKIVDKNGKQTTVLVNPNKGTKTTGKGGERWAKGSPARVSKRNRVESVPTPPACSPSLGGLAALADEAPVRIHGHMHPTSYVPRDNSSKPSAARTGANVRAWTYLPEPVLTGNERFVSIDESKLENGTPWLLPEREERKTEMRARLQGRRDLFPDDSRDFDVDYEGYDEYRSWSIDEDGATLTVKRVQRIGPAASEPVALTWRDEEADDSAVPTVETEDGTVHYVEGEEFDAWVDTSVERINDGLDGIVADIDLDRQIEDETRRLEDTWDYRALAADLGYDTEDMEYEEEQEALADLRDLVKVKVTWSTRHINRDDFISNLRDDDRLPAE